MILPNDQQNELLLFILEDIGLKYPENNVSNEIKYIEFNVYQNLKSYIIDFDKVLKIFPFFQRIIDMYDLEFPSEYPLGSITEERIDEAKKLKSFIYCYVLSLFFVEIIWDQKDFCLKIPEYFLK